MRRNSLFALFLSLFVISALGSEPAPAPAAAAAHPEPASAPAPAAAAAPPAPAAAPAAAAAAPSAPEAAASTSASASASASAEASSSAASGSSASAAAAAAEEGGRKDESEKWTELPLEAAPHLPTIPRRGVSDQPDSNLVLKIDLDQRLTPANAQWPKFSSIPRMCTPDYSISFWLDINDETGREWRTVFYKGDTKGERSPALFIHPVTKRLQVHQSVGEGKFADIQVLKKKKK